jgi:hypothetical protein
MIPLISPARLLVLGRTLHNKREEKHHEEQEESANKTCEKTSHRGTCQAKQ